MAIIAVHNLIAKFKYALDNGWGYIWGQWGAVWTQAKQTQKINYMIANYGSDWKSNANAKNDNYYYSAFYGAKWIGKQVADCSGLFRWAFDQLGGAISHSSNRIWEGYCSSRGNLKQGARTDGNVLLPGTAVFVHPAGKNRTHIGLYIGDGTVIEASGTQAGVITSQITNKKWVEWGELKGVDYGSTPTPGPSPKPTPEPEPAAGEAIVTGVNVALRCGPTTSAAVITRIATGNTVKIAKPPDDWEYVQYGDKSGYMMKKYLKEG